MAIIRVPSGTLLLCDRFSISAYSTSIKPFLSILDISLFNTSDTHTFDLSPTLTNSTRWHKLPYIPEHFQAIIDFLASTLTPSTSQLFQYLQQHSFSYIVLSFIIITLTLFTSLFYYHRIRKPTVPSINFQLPSTAGADSS